MIRLIRFDGQEILLNIDVIKSIEKVPETVINLTTGEKIKIKNSVRDVVEKMKAYQEGLKQIESKDKMSKTRT